MLHLSSMNHRLEKTLTAACDGCQFIPAVLKALPGHHLALADGMVTSVESDLDAAFSHRTIAPDVSCKPNAVHL